MSHASTTPPAPTPATYTSPIPFECERIHAVAIYCSDGRYGTQFDDFLQGSLQLPRYDRLAIPGGPGCLAGHASAFRHEEALVSHLRFLIEHHDLHRVVLIAHHGCVFYTKHLALTPDDAWHRQIQDLAKVAQRIRRIDDRLQVQAFTARAQTHGVTFEPAPT